MKQTIHFSLLAMLLMAGAQCSSYAGNEIPSTPLKAASAAYNSVSFELESPDLDENERKTLYSKIQSELEDSGAFGKVLPNSEKGQIHLRIRIARVEKLEGAVTTFFNGLLSGFTLTIVPTVGTYHYAYHVDIFENNRLTSRRNYDARYYRAVGLYYAKETFTEKRNLQATIDDGHANVTRYVLSELLLAKDSSQALRPTAQISD